MKIPAIRAKIGDWDYYVTTLTFDQVNTFVSKINDELHKSENLKELIQRSITNNYQSIKDYIINQKELFFNALVLAVYDDYPDWREIEFVYEELETYQMGILEFPGTHKVFPVDGQHRVEGIKEALKHRPELGTQRIATIFIGHKNSEEGMKRTRRLFSTLNRYAKPVTMDDIIALDEDDCVAIVTRELLETFHLFTDSRITKSKNKAISDTDKHSFTSIITLYQCNLELLKYFRSERKISRPDPTRDKLKLKEYQKFRPAEDELKEYELYCREFWKEFSDNFSSIQEYLSLKIDNPALKFRNKESGGNLLFRPIGLLPLVQAALEIRKRKNMDLASVFGRLNKLEMIISKEPWKNVVWRPNEKIMIMAASNIVKILIMYMFGLNVINEKELRILEVKYADLISLENTQHALLSIPRLE